MSEYTSCSGVDSDLEGEDQRFVLANQANGVAVFSDSLLKKCKAKLEGDDIVLTCQVFPGAKSARIKEEVKNFLTTTSTPGPLVIVVCVGSNDIFPRRNYTRTVYVQLTSEQADAHADRVTKIPNKCRAEIVNIVKEHSPHNRVIFCTVPPRLNLNAGDTRAFLRTNQEIRKTNFQNFVPNIDIEGVVSRNRLRGDVELFMYARVARLEPDGIHPTQETADRWTKEILKVAKSLC